MPSCYIGLGEAIAFSLKWAAMSSEQKVAYIDRYLPPDVRRTTHPYFDTRFFYQTRDHLRRLHKRGERRQSLKEVVSDNNPLLEAMKKHSVKPIDGGMTITKALTYA